MCRADIKIDAAPAPAPCHSLQLMRLFYPGGVRGCESESSRSASSPLRSLLLILETDQSKSLKFILETELRYTLYFLGRKKRSKIDPAQLIRSQKKAPTANEQQGLFNRKMPSVFLRKMLSVFLISLVVVYTGIPLGFVTVGRR